VVRELLGASFIGEQPLSPADVALPLDGAPAAAPLDGAATLDDAPAAVLEPAPVDGLPFEPEPDPEDD